MLLDVSKSQNAEALFYLCWFFCCLYRVKTSIDGREMVRLPSKNKLYSLRFAAPASGCTLWKFRKFRKLRKAGQYGLRRLNRNSFPFSDLTPFNGTTRNFYHLLLFVFFCLFLFVFFYDKTETNRFNCSVLNDLIENCRAGKHYHRIRPLSHRI